MKHTARYGPCAIFPVVDGVQKQRFWVRCKCGTDLYEKTKPELLKAWDDHRRQGYPSGNGD